jgi:cell shape-determining protein MreC
MAAEEDKRRRNTAASARFRVKKKQREQALEKTTKEMSDKVQALESKILQLEMENKWLKELITEKAGAGASEGASNVIKAESTAPVDASTENTVTAASREIKDSSEQTS